MQQIFVTGAGAFIGSNLVDRLLACGKSAVGWDNLSTGQERLLELARSHNRFRFVRGDSSDALALTEAMKGCNFVFHLAADADAGGTPVAYPFNSPTRRR